MICAKISGKWRSGYEEVYQKSSMQFHFVVIISFNIINNHGGGTVGLKYEFFLKSSINLCTDYKRLIRIACPVIWNLQNHMVYKNN